MNISNKLDALGPPAEAPILCFSHLRWDPVTQRPQHLMSRFARTRSVWFWEEPIPTDHHLPYFEIHSFAGTRVRAIRPRVPAALPEQERDAVLATLLAELVAVAGLRAPVLWFYTPMMLPMARAAVPHASAVVYDCMDELANFRFAPPEIGRMEAELMRTADLAFTGGWSLYEAKRLLHDDIHAVPSGVDLDHFGKARVSRADPPDQAGLPGPRLGYFGVIDERIDLALLDQVARARPDWSFVMVGPVVKISPEDLPKPPNLHWLGVRPYAQLPDYIAGWAVALMPFALNEATRFISPTKTPEYLAAGCPVASTPVADVCRRYGDVEGVRIGRGADGFLQACDEALALSRREDWLAQADAEIATQDWDQVQARMAALLENAMSRRVARARPPQAPRVRKRHRRYDAVIVGAGFAGSVMAERLAAGSGLRVLVCDRRSHVGGNAHDRLDAAGILVHPYGPHIFHTNSERIVAYLSRFTHWRPYEHRVLAEVGGARVPIPINRTTLEHVFGRDLRRSEDAAALLAGLAVPVEAPANAREVVVGQVGERLYRLFFRDYTRKQWGIDPTELDPSVTARVPARTSRDDRYFQDMFQAMPRDGYTRMFEAMLDHERIDLALGTDFADLGAEAQAPLTIYTGPIDDFFGHRLGPLPYRSLRFEHQTLPVRRHQEVAVVNYPDAAVPYTRITEYKHLTGQSHPFTSISREYPSADGDPYYPVPREENRQLYRRYQALAAGRPDVVFLGRLGTYRYYNMDQVVGQALATYERLAKSLPQLAAGGAGGEGTHA